MSRARDRGFKETTRIEEAKKILFDALPETRLEAEIVPIHLALNRVLAEDVIARSNVPPFDKAAMDGYAVIAEDTFGASQTNPMLFRVMGESRIGEVPHIQVGRGEAVAVATGSQIPPGADAVVMIEYVKRLEGGQVEVYAGVAPGENISRSGEDVKAGSTVLRRGTKLKPPDIGLLAALGHREVSVRKKPLVAVLSTGDELVNAFDSGKPGKIVDVNRPVMSAMIEEAGGLPVDLGIARDHPSEIRGRLEEGLRKADAVIVTAGTSVGKGDLVPDIVDSLGKPGMLVHGVAMRPSLPTGLAVVRGKPLISLPGFPVSAIFSFTTFVRPLILRMLGTEEEPQPTVRARLRRRIAGVPGFRTFLRVVVRESERGYVAEPIRVSGASVLTSMTRANGIIVIPEDKEGFEADEEVEVFLLRPVECGA